MSFFRDRHGLSGGWMKYMEAELLDQTPVTFFHICIDLSAGYGFLLESPKIN
jgi:hypothetical protein